MDHEIRSIVAGLRAGDAQALRRAYERFKNDALAVANAMLGRKDPEAAWDVLHDVFVSLARAAPQLPPDTNLRAYLVRASANRARDVLRRQVVRTAHELPDDVPHAQAGPLERVQCDEEILELMRALAELPEEQRTVVSLRVWGAMSFTEIAKLEGVSENTLHSRYRYAILKLRRHERLGVER